MSPAKADDPLRKVTLYLYEADCKAMEALHGHGWSGVVRGLVHGHVQRRREAPKTIGELLNGQ